MRAAVFTRYGPPDVVWIKSRGEISSQCTRVSENHFWAKRFLSSSVDETLTTHSEPGYALRAMASTIGLSVGEVGLGNFGPVFRPWLDCNEFLDYNTRDWL